MRFAVHRVELDRGEGFVSVLLPFTRAFVPEIDLAAGRVVADPPDGLFDVAEAQPEGSSPEGDEAELRPVPPPPAPAGPAGRRKGGRW